MHPMLNTAIKAARRAATVINRASFDLDRITVSEKQHNDFVTDVDQASEQAIVETLLKAYPDHAILGEESGPSRNLNDDSEYVWIIDPLDRITVSEKQHNDFVTDVDQASEQAIVETLLKAYPDHAILGEESGPSRNLNDDSEYVWIIDPLDGTTNFMHGYPNFCISIALQHKGVITQAVIYDPVRNDLFTASKGAGSYLNDKRIRVKNHDRIGKALIAAGHGPDPRALAEYLRMYEVVASRCHGVRSSGSAALELANVAAGRVDGFFEKGLKIWDIAAGSLLVTEAGGICGEFNGESAYLNKGDIMAAGPKVFAQMVPLMVPFA